MILIYLKRYCVCELHAAGKSQLYVRSSGNIVPHKMYMLQSPRMCTMRVTTHLINV